MKHTQVIKRKITIALKAGRLAPPKPFSKRLRGIPYWVRMKNGKYKIMVNACCGLCQGYGTVYGSYVDSSFEYQTGHVDCKGCGGVGFSKKLFNFH